MTDEPFITVKIAVSRVDALLEWLDESDLFDDVIGAIVRAEVEVAKLVGRMALLAHPLDYTTSLGSPIRNHPEGIGSDYWWRLDQGSSTFAASLYWKRSVDSQTEREYDGFYHVQTDRWVATARELP